MSLKPDGLPDGVRHVSLGETDSTNSRARALACDGVRGPLWVTAQSQTAGRGRRGNRWVSEPGNVYASLLLSDLDVGARAAELSFVAALAVHDAVLACVPSLGSRLTLKWPNDALLDGGKLAGILIEGEGRHLIVGIGINCAHHPQDTPYPATDLAAHQAFASAAEIFVALSHAMQARLAQWDCGTGFAAIRADWLARAGGVGLPIRVRLTGREIEGCFEALDAHGRLVLRRSDGGCETITAGDVFPLSLHPHSAELDTLP